MSLDQKSYEVVNDLNNKNIQNKKSITAVFLSVAMIFHSPTGHDAVHEGLLRLWFAGTVFISSQTLRDNAEILAYDPNPDIFIHNMRLLTDDFSFCLPFVDDDNENPKTPTNSFIACHASAVREEKKNNKGLKI
jgi:hypothetical protein